MLTLLSVVRFLLLVIVLVVIACTLSSMCCDDSKYPIEVEDMFSVIAMNDSICSFFHSRIAAPPDEGPRKGRGKGAFPDNFGFMLFIAGGV